MSNKGNMQGRDRRRGSEEKSKSGIKEEKQRREIAETYKNGK